jgi:integrase
VARADGRVVETKRRGAWWALPGAADETWPGTKNKQSHKVWLTPAALAVIEELEEEEHEGYVLGPRAPKLRLDVAMAAICEKLKVERAVPHDLRRTHGTTITRLGFTRDTMNRVQNHKEGGIGSVYDRHEYADEARRAQEAVSAFVMARLNGASAKVFVLKQRRAS